MNSDYRRISRQDWDQYSKQLLMLEELFAPELALDFAKKKALYTAGGLVSVVCFDNGQLVGERFGLPIELFGNNKPAPFQINEIESYPGYGDENTLYTYAVAVKENHQSRGIGAGLAERYFKEAKKEGFHSVVGHVREDSYAFHINKRFWAKCLARFDKWYDDPNPHVLYQIILQK